MPSITENPTCEVCRCTMEMDGVEKGRIAYKCPNNCAIWEYLKKYDVEFTKDELERYARMEPDFLTKSKPYQNHCWNCKAPIHSDYCKKDPIPDCGYICNVCGKSLREWKALCGLGDAGLL